jgi:hypothetical protein
MHFLNPQTAESRIKQKHNMSIVEFFGTCLEDGMDTSEIAELAGCSLSNLRRIARKYKFSFYQPEPTPMYSENGNFKLTALNQDNLLSRRWVRASA